MVDVFVSYAHKDRPRVVGIAAGLEESGYEVWWDRKLRANQEFRREIEAKLGEAKCAVVAWSATGRESLWVEAEANLALETGKLVQVTLDGSKPPLPFTMIQILNLSTWDGRVANPSWSELLEAVEAVGSGEAQPTLLGSAPRSRLGGFTSAAVAGAASLGLVVVAAGIVGVGATGVLSSGWFGFASGGAFIAACLAFTHMLTRVISIAAASQ